MVATVVGELEVGDFPVRVRNREQVTHPRGIDPLTVLREKEYAYLAGDAFPPTLAAYGLALT